MNVWSPFRHHPVHQTLPQELQYLFATLSELQSQEILGLEQLQTHVYRIEIRDDQRARSLIVKRSEPERALRNRLALERWLPAVGLQAVGPRLLGAVAEPDGRHIWQVYGDLGVESLAVERPDPAHVAIAIEAIAHLHLRFARHALLGECRLWGGDLGIHFFTSSVQDAIYALESLRSPSVTLRREHRDLRDRLLDRLHDLLAEDADRGREMQEWGGPETLLHGDLWRDNVFVVPTPAGLEARLIDWDHVAVGPVAYDLSTFLTRFRPTDRLWILERYEESVVAAGWHVPPHEQLNRIFDTAERARITNRLIWPAIAVRQGDDPEWGLEKLTEVAGWLDDVRFVLPTPEPDSGRLPDGGRQ